MRRLRKSKKKYEARIFIRQRLNKIKEYTSIIAQMDTFTADIRDDGISLFCIPSRATFERITPDSEPMGIIFPDDSFLVAKEVFHYDYPNDEADEPRICPLEYGYHYQRPHENSFFRYDFHPDVGETETHPLYHLHAFGWADGAIALPSVPRFSVQSITLDEVLELIRISFFEQGAKDA